MPDRVEVLRNLILQHRTAGHSPQEIHMSAATRASFAEEAGIAPESDADTRSLWQRWGGSPSAPGSLLRFEGVLLVENPAMGDGAMLVRPPQLMQDPNWLETIRWAEHAEKIAGVQAQQPATHVSTDTPWHQRSTQGEASPGGGVIADLATGGGVNPTTVLLKAMDGLDKIEDLVVLRFYKGGAIDLCSTMNKYGVVGALQAAIGHVMNGDD